MMNKITDITQQTNHKDRYSVYIDGKFAFGISDFDLLKLSLKVGQELSNNELQEIMYTLDETKCQDYANSLVCARLYTEKEIKKKLVAKKFSVEVIKAVIQKLAEYGYINDRAFAEAYVSETKQKYGVYKIRQKLYEKGVPEKIIDECLEELDNKGVAVNQLKIKLRNKRIITEDKQKLLRFLAQKGFAYDEAHDAIRIYMEEFNDIDDE